MLYCDTFTNTGVILAKISAKHQIRLPKNGAITTVNSAVITSERLPMAPSTSPISSVAAQRGCGVTLNGAPIRASSRDAAHAIVACGSTIYDRSYTDRHFAILRHLYDRCLDYRRFASAALDCCMVACGRAEIFFECRLSPWDYAAGSLIAQEAGGVAVRLDGSFLDPLRPGSVFITNAACREMRQGLPE